VESIRLVQFNIARATISTRNLNELFEFIKQELNSIIDANNFVIAFYNEETGMLSANVDKDEKDEIPEWPAKNSITGYVIRQNRPVLLRKKEILQLHAEGVFDLIGTTAEAWLGVPLKVKGKTLGAVVVQNYDNPDAYDQASIEIMELVSHELSMFIDWQGAEGKATKLSRAVEQSSVSVMITNREGVIEYVNPFFTKLTGYSLEEVMGENPKILQSGHQSNAFYQKLWDTILSGKDWEGEMLNKKKNGDLYWEQAVISAIVNSDGMITNFVAIKEDITERKKMLEDLVAAKEKAEESDRLKSAFLANMSHEIRTPMNGIIGFADILKRHNLTDAERQKYISIIEKSGARLLNIINDIIDISKIETGLMKAYIRESDVNEQIEYIYTFFKHEVNAKGIELAITDSLPINEAIIHTDREKVFAILTNLVKNAIKYTKEGSIEFGCVKKGGFLEFYVKDTGTGIPKSRQEAIFERFIQADIDDKMALQGTGLGLSISKAYVEMLGGNIWVESKEGIGSTFYFTLPYNTAQHKQFNRGRVF
jgi:PAS domain S-box-containing protein